MNIIDVPLFVFEKMHGSNPSHYYTIRGYKVCARCSGLIVAAFIAICTFWMLEAYTFNLTVVFLVSSVLGAICCFNWVIGQFKNVSNNSRFIAGMAGGFGVAVYAELLPVPEIVRVITLGVICVTLFAEIVVIRKLKKEA